MRPNTLYYGDNLDILRRYIPDESVDLVYLDPPFNSAQDYNVLFAERDGSRAAAQIKAFADTWAWDQEAARAFQQTVERGGYVSRALQAFRTFIGESDMLAYLSMMAPRLVELRRALKETGSLYLHCDPTASHYLKMLLDAAFGPANFRNEIIWKRSHAHNSAQRFAPVHDTIFLYTRTDQFTWNQTYEPLPQATIDAWYNNVEEESGRRFNRADLTAPGVRSGPSGATWRGRDVTAKGRHWAIPRFVGDLVAGLDTIAALEALDAAGRLHWPKKPGGMPMLKRYLEEATGAAAQDVITDIPPIHNLGAERLGYPTQKPEALLERLISASSNPGDVVLDPFCGCGTAVAAAQRLERRWIGIDITHLAINLVRHRLRDAFGQHLQVDVVGEPVSLSGAEDLAASDPYQFQWWTLGLVGARPVEQKKGADRGIDGRLFFHDDLSGKTRQVIFSVKAGKTGRAHVHELRGVLEREAAAGAVIAVLISMQEPTRSMREEAASAGFYDSPFGSQHARLQLLTVEQLLNGAMVDMPPSKADQTFKRAPKAKSREEQPDLDFD